MAVAFCTRCGAGLPPGATFCPACGAAVEVAYVSALPTFRAPPNPWATARRVTRAGPGSAGDGDPRSDRRALDRVQVAALLGLLASLVSVGLEVSGETTFGVVTFGTSATAPVELSAWFLALAGASFVVGVATLLLFRSAFVALRGTAEAFSSPASLLLVGLVGLGLLFPAFAVALVGVKQATNCLHETSSGTPLCGSLAVLFAGVGLLLVAVVLLLVGAIGLLLGIWRLGTRYDNSFFSVGAILLILPYVSVVGFLLILLAAHGELRRLARPGALPPSF